MSGDPQREADARRRILLVVPRKDRDLEGHALVGYFLRSRYRHDVFLTNVDGFEQTLLERAPDAVVFDYLGLPSRARQARFAKSLGIRVAVLPIAGLYEDEEDHARTAGKPTGVSGLVDCYLAWGDVDYRVVVEQSLVPQDRIHKVGSPRFDFYSPPYLSLMRPRLDFLGRLGTKKTDAPLIVWATSTPHFARPIKKTVPQLMMSGRVTKAQARADLEDERTQFIENSRVVLELARRHRDWNFVVKVHPVEPVHPYRDLARQAPNLFVASEAPIREFLCHASVLLQRGCTTASEAWMLGKPVLELAVGASNRAWVPDSYLRGNHVVASIDEADDAVCAYVDGRAVPAEQREARAAFIAEAYGLTDGKAGERCAEKLHRLVVAPARTDEEHEVSRRKVRETLEKRRREQKNRVWNRLKDALGVSREVSLRFWRWSGKPRRSGVATAGERRISEQFDEEAVQRLFRRFDSVRDESREASCLSS
jgi:surface carbohydrate biosynthesis protein